MAGSNPDFERSAEDRARAAAERAARRAARAGRPVPPPPAVEDLPAAPVASSPEDAPPAGADEDATPVRESPGAPQHRDAPPAGAGEDATLVHESLVKPEVAPEVAAPPDVGDAPSPPAGPPAPVRASGPGAASHPDAAGGSRDVAAQSPAAAGDEPATEPVPAAEPVPAGRRDVPLASARPIAVGAAVAPRGSRGDRSRVRVPAEPRSHGRQGGRWSRRLLALVALAAIGGALYLINATFQPFHDAGRGAVRVSIPEGADVAGIGAVLERRGVVASGRFFNANVTLTGRRGRLRPGDYVLRQDMSYGDASEALMQGPEVKVVETFELTIPEGRSVREVARLVADSPVRGRYARAAREKRFLRRARELGLPAGRQTLEGFLFPATYELTGDSDARDLIGKQLDAFEQNLASIPMKRAKRRNLTRYDVLIIASMVEREAALSKERPLIAAVIHNRLRAGMPLGIDATIRYATNNWQRPIRVSELEQDGPYNTRLRQGLPPTPIGNPGLDSLKAAADPADVDYLYYVVKPGTCGEHAFSASDAQFQRDSARYNAERAAAGGKSPTTC